MKYEPKWLCFELFSKNSSSVNKNGQVKTVSNNGICKHLWSGKGVGQNRRITPKLSTLNEAATVSEVPNQFSRKEALSGVNSS